MSEPNAAATTADATSSNNVKHNVDYDDEALWEEKRFLRLLEHYSQVLLERKQRR